MGFLVLICFTYILILPAICLLFLLKFGLKEKEGGEMGKTEKREMIHGVEREEKVKGTD